MRLRYVPRQFQRRRHCAKRARHSVTRRQDARILSGRSERLFINKGPKLLELIYQLQRYSFNRLVNVIVDERQDEFFAAQLASRAKDWNRKAWSLMIAEKLGNVLQVKVI